MFLRFRKKLYGASALLILILGVPTFASAGAKIKVDDTKWFSVGMGFRSSIAVTEDGADNGTSSATNFGFDNMRLYTAAKVHENVTVEFNTEHRGGNTIGEKNKEEAVRVLDAVAKFSVAGFDFWTGRFLPPSDRSNLDGPFYLNAYGFPGVAQAYPSLENGRDNGVAIMKEYNGGQFKWSYGLFEGRTTDTNVDANPDQEDNFLHAARATINFWDPEPGYYTTSSYYGAKDVLALAFVYQHEEDGAGTGTTDALRADFDAWSIDGLMEKKIQNGAVVNLEGAYYNYDTDDKVDTSITQGQSYLLLGSYLMPNSIGWGKLQPYVRQQHFVREAGGDGGRWRTEGGLNYIIDGQNAKLNATYYVDKNGTGADEKGTFLVGFQFQL
jgi:hypothetical protein